MYGDGLRHGINNVYGIGLVPGIGNQSRMVFGTACVWDRTCSWYW